MLCLCQCFIGLIWLVEFVMRVKGLVACGVNGNGEEEVLVSRGWVQVRYRWLFGLSVKDHGGGGRDCEGLRRVGWSPVLVYDVALSA